MGSSDSDGVEDSAASECEDTLLFYFQTKFMRNMLRNYRGSVGCVHKAGEHALPPSLLAVKMPSGYTQAGMFIVQFDTAHCITEALDVFKQWCNNWSPQHWMEDYSKTKIDAFQQVLPESKISICDFHKKQAWQRWLGRQENSMSDLDEAPNLIKHLASASNPNDFYRAFKVLVA